MNHIEIEKKWRSKWKDDKGLKFDPQSGKEKFYMLEMFSYPSGANLHLGHWYNFALCDSYARFKRMTGYNVFHPMGFDSFGLPAENYAIKTGVHPKISIENSVKVMERQFFEMGGMFDWEYKVMTSAPEYYKWTQWIFIQLYKKGLAYRKEAPVNYCPSCKTVLANEQAADGICERCETAVIRKNLTQWFFKITDYAEELIEGLKTLDWPEKTKTMQTNWIGKSIGGEIEFLLDTGDAFKVYTTRADTLFGVTYVVLAPEHPLVEKITTDEQKNAVSEYISECAKVSEIDRLSTAKEKTGVFTGAYCHNPINNRRVEVWIGDYVLYSYGTGAVMGVPSHDARDYVFAKKYNLPIERVIKASDSGTNDDLPFTEDGIMVNSGKFSNLPSAEGRTAVIQKLSAANKGCEKINYRLRDWGVSRQRYWGAPIPIIHCATCGTVEVPECDLPVLLPDDVEFNPDGSSPLLRHEGFMNVKCPKCGRPARRDSDTLDTFVDSSWYFLRYPDAKNSKEAFNKDLINKMLPVDKYVGGVEHACMHLLYARFFTKALRDTGYLDFDEPFKGLVHQGLILGEDGLKMSKRNSAASPDVIIEKFGSDTLRTYLGFGFRYIDGGPWSEDGLKAVYKWIERVVRLVESANPSANNSAPCEDDGELGYVRHSTIKAVRRDYEEFGFNTAVARMMEFSNALQKYGRKDGKFYLDCVCDLVKMLAPLAPHTAEELWEILGMPYSVFNQGFPEFDESALILPTIEIALQINSKIRGKLSIDNGLSPDKVEAFVRQSAEVISLIGDGVIKKIIVVPGRLVNIIV